jgi:hypothetical protein
MGNRAVPSKTAATTDEAGERALLVARAAANPNEFFSFRECGIILGFGVSAMSVLNAAGAPVAFRKMNPTLIRQWIAENPTLVSKGSEEEK